MWNHTNQHVFDCYLNLLDDLISTPYSHTKWFAACVNQGETSSTDSIISQVKDKRRISHLWSTFRRLYTFRGVSEPNCARLNNQSSWLEPGSVLISSAGPKLKLISFIIEPDTSCSQTARWSHGETCKLFYSTITLQTRKEGWDQLVAYIMVSLTWATHEWLVQLTRLNEWRTRF